MLEWTEKNFWKTAYKKFEGIYGLLKQSSTNFTWSILECFDLTCLLIIILLITTSSLVKGVRIRSYSGLYFPAFGLNTERYGVCLRIQSECQKIRTRITPNTDTFHAVLLSQYDKQNKTNRADYSQILSENVRDQKKGRERERDNVLRR